MECVVAEKRKAGFNIPLNFYDGPEVESIPRRIRAAAIGVWALAGDYAATQLTDGYVPAGMLKMFGCTDAIRAALKVTINKKGELSPLWEDARNGGIQLTNWAKHQRTNDEVTTYRANEAERKRRERLGGRKGSTSANEDLSGRTDDGQGEDVRSDAGDPKTETKPKSSCTYVNELPTDPRGAGVSATPGADLVHEVVPSGHPPATLTSLRLQASELLNTGTERDIVKAALELWCEKPGLGIGRTILSSLVSEVIKTRASPVLPIGRRPAASDAAFAQAQALKLVPNDRLELE